jgi:hypothetical protein
MTPNDLCVQTGHQGACQMCCAADQANGYDVYISAVIQYCACTTGAACYSACSGPMDLCADPSAMTGSNACIDCVNGVSKTDPCFTGKSQSVDAACAADSGCTAMQGCWTGCASLPM